MSLRARYPYYLACEPVHAGSDLAVHNKYDGTVATHVALADADTIDRAIAAATAAATPMRRLPAWKRAAVLQHVVRRIEERHEELAHALCIEAGKPLRDARGEVTRSVDTFRIAAEESVRQTGEHLPLDISPRADGYQAIWKRVPIGPCSFISPFNFPLNLVAHKIAPAIAVGCPFVLKPASLTPVGALILGEILAETDLPPGAFSILPATRASATAFTEDPRLKLLSFTGSPGVGWALKARAGKKKVVLELGGNAACIVDTGTDLDFATQRLVTGAFYQSGQSCIGVQRILAHADIYDALRDKLVAATRALPMGDPLSPDTFIGPMITAADAARMATWTAEAVAAGATVLCGGRRDGVFFEATLLEGAPHHTKVQAEEVFGPIACLEPFTDFAAAVDTVNDSRFGLQAGVFTRDIHRAFYAFEEIEAGGVVINDIPSMRVDSMPYGGVKDSGLGREGIRFAMEDMTEIRLLVLHRVGQL